MKRDEMSLVMLINKIQTPEDCENFRKVSEDLVNFIYSNAPEAIKEIYKKILWALLIKMNVPADEAREMMGEIGGRGMGYLFENMEKMDIQAERRNTQRERERADAAEELVETERERANAAEELVETERERANAAEELVEIERERANAAELEIQRLKKELEKRANVCN